MLDKKKVFIIGGEHHNELYLSRNIGNDEFEICCLLFPNQNYSYTASPRYIKSTSYFVSIKDAFDYLLEKTICRCNYSFSDKAAIELDLRLNEFINFYIVPSINKKEGEIARLMSKEQFKLS